MALSTIDPKTAGPVCVYAVVMDEIEHRKFRDNLELGLPKFSEEPVSPGPEVVASLSQVGSIEILGGEARATLVDPPVETLTAPDTWTVSSILSEALPKMAGKFTSLGGPAQQRQTAPAS